MVVLIPHSTEELFLFNLQKELIKNLHAKNLFFSAIYPLWIPLTLPLAIPETTENIPTSEEQSLKVISKKIKRVSLQNLSYNSSESSLRTILCEVTINFENQIINAKLPLLQEFLKNKSSSDEEIKTALSNININSYKDFKIFRVGIQKKTEQTNSCAIEESVWCKIK